MLLDYELLPSRKCLWLVFLYCAKHSLVAWLMRRKCGGMTVIPSFSGCDAC